MTPEGRLLRLTLGFEPGMPQALPRDLRQLVEKSPSNSVECRKRENKEVAASGRSDLDRGSLYCICWYK